MAVPQLRREFGVVEVVEPGRTVARRVPLEVLHGRAHRPVAGRSVTEPGERARLHRVEVRRQDRDTDRLRTEPCGPRHIGRFSVPTEEARLVAHRVEDACGEQPILTGVGQPESLDEVTLCQPVQASVVRHPCCELRRLASRREQRAANVRRPTGPQQPR